MTKTMLIEVESFVREHQDDLRDYLRLLGCTTADADDISQEAFLVVMRQGVPERDRAGNAAFLRRTAANILKSDRRLQGRRLAILKEEAAERIWTRHQLDRGLGDYLRILRDCLQGVDEKARRTLDLIYGQGMSGIAVAELMERSQSEVNTTLHRTRRKLRVCMERKL